MFNKPIHGMGKRIKYLRESRSISIERLAFQLGCSVDQLRAVEESGVMESGTTHVAQVAKCGEILGVGLDYLFWGQEACDESVGALFTQELQNAKNFAVDVLADQAPMPTAAEVKAVLGEVQRRFELHEAEQSQAHAGTKFRENRFKIDDVGIVRLLAHVRKQQRNL